MSVEGAAAGKRLHLFLCVPERLLLVSYGVIFLSTLSTLSTML